MNHLSHPTLYTKRLRKKPFRRLLYTAFTAIALIILLLLPILMP